MTFPFTPYTEPLASRAGLLRRYIAREWTLCAIAYGHEPRPQQWAHWLETVTK